MKFDDRKSRYPGNITRNVNQLRRNRYNLTKVEYNNRRVCICSFYNFPIFIRRNLDRYNLCFNIRRERRFFLSSLFDHRKYSEPKQSIHFEKTAKGNGFIDNA